MAKGIVDKVSIMTAYKRMTGLDVARACALFYMIVVNSWTMVQETVPGWVDEVLLRIQGKAAVTFIILSGIGLSLASYGGYERVQAAGRSTLKSSMLKRALFLFIIGSLHSLIWSSDILHFYAFYILTGLFLLNGSNSKLWLFIVLPILVLILFIPWKDDVTGKSFLFFDYGYLMNPLELYYHYFVDGCYAFFPWIAFFIFGLWLGRKRLTDRAVYQKIIFWGAAMTLLFEGTSALYLHYYSWGLLSPYMENLAFWFVIDPWKPTPFFVFSAVGVALVIIGTCLAAAEKIGDKKVLLPFVYTGKTTLTLYVFQAVSGHIILSHVNQTLFFSTMFLVVGSICYVLFSLVFSFLWCKRFQKGPLELLVRWFTTARLFRLRRPLDISEPVKQMVE